MKLILSGKQLDLTEALKELVTSEFAFLEESLPKGKVVTVTLESKPAHKATILFYHEQNVFQMSDSGNDLYMLIPKLAKKMKKHLREFSEMKKAFVKERHNAKKHSPMDKAGLDMDFDLTPAVTKRKSFEMKPMSEAEAILQLSALGHEQFIFANAELNCSICLLYTRKNGTFGVIETTT